MKFFGPIFLRFYFWYANPPHLIIQHNYDTDGCSASFVALFSEFREGKEMQAIGKMVNRVMC